jgi:hypothetical protein
MEILASLIAKYMCRRITKLYVDKNFHKPELVLDKIDLCRMANEVT